MGGNAEVLYDSRFQRPANPSLHSLNFSRSTLRLKISDKDVRGLIE